MMANVGLVISSVTPNPFAMPWDRCVFPVPKSPIKAMHKGFGVTEEITSPTFAIMNTYDVDRTHLYHFDVYRLDDISELENIGFYEYTEDCVSIVEWADKFSDELPDETLWIYLTRIDDTSRSITLSSDYLTKDDLVDIGGPYVVGN